MLGALAPSGSSDTAALQAALATGRDVLLAPGTYLAATQTLQDGSARMQIIPHNAAAAAGPAVPITWATGDEVRASVTYSV